MNSEFKSAISSVSNAVALNELMEKPLQWQYLLTRRTTPVEHKFIHYRDDLRPCIIWSHFKIRVENIVRLYHVETNECLGGSYYEMIARINEPTLGELGQDLYIHLYAQSYIHDESFWRGFIFMSRNINWFMAMIMKQRLKQLFICNIDPSYARYQEHHYCDCTKCTTEKKIQLRSLDKEAILQSLADDGLTIDLIYIENPPSLVSFCYESIYLKYFENLPFLPKILRNDFKDYVKFRKQLNEIKDVYNKPQTYPRFPTYWNMYADQPNHWWSC